MTPLPEKIREEDIIKRDENGRPLTVIIQIPPFVGLIDHKFLKRERAEEVVELTDGILRDANAMKKGLRYSQQKNTNAWGTGLRGMALAHPQVNTRPYAFFVMTSVEGLKEMVIFNPYIIEGKRKRQKWEKCLSFPYHGKAHPDRFEEVKVQYQTMLSEEGSLELKLSEPIVEWISGTFAQVFQHETQHIEGKSIW